MIQILKIFQTNQSINYTSTVKLTFSPEHCFIYAHFSNLERKSFVQHSAFYIKLANSTISKRFKLYSIKQLQVTGGFI